MLWQARQHHDHELLPWLTLWQAWCHDLDFYVPAGMTMLWPWPLHFYVLADLTMPWPWPFTLTFMLWQALWQASQCHDFDLLPWLLCSGRHHSAMNMTFYLTFMLWQAWQCHDFDLDFYALAGMTMPWLWHFTLTFMLWQAWQCHDFDILPWLLCSGRHDTFCWASFLNYCLWTLACKNGNFYELQNKMPVCNRVLSLAYRKCHMWNCRRLVHFCISRIFTLCQAFMKFLKWFS